MATIAANHVEQIDFAEVNGCVFLNNSSIGTYPSLVAERTAAEAVGGGKLATLGPAQLATDEIMDPSSADGKKTIYETQVCGVAGHVS